MKSNSNLINDFITGNYKTDNKQEANSMTIKENGDHSLLIGYGHAIYGIRTPEGHIHIFNSWYGRSSTTSTHLNRLKGSTKGKKDSDLYTIHNDKERPQVRGSFAPKTEVLKA